MTSMMRVLDRLWGTATWKAKVEPARHLGDFAQLQQSPNLMSLPVAIRLPTLCDSQDIAIAIVSGKGHLTLSDTSISLETGRLLWIPAGTSYELQTQSSLVFWLERSEPEPGSQLSAWLISL